MAQEELVSQEWIVEVKSFLKASDKDVPASTAGMRLPKSIRNANAEAYTPQMVSLGPYHHRTLKDEPVGPYHQRLCHLSQMEFYKLKSTREALAAKIPPLSIEEFFTKITQREVISKFEQFYDWKIGADDIPKFGWMIIVDAFFLFQFLKNGFNFFLREVSPSDPKSKSDDILMPAVSSANILKSGRFNFFQRGRSLSGTNSKSNGIHMPAVSSIRCDIVKLENQVPLFLLKDIGNTLQTGIFKSCLHSRIASLSSFQVSHDKVKEESHDNHIEEVKEEKHLLGCIHEYVSSFLQMNSPKDDDNRDPTYYETIITVIDDIVAAIFGIFCPHPARRGRDDFLDKYNATALVKAGIKFKSFKKGSGKIRFDKYSDTCYIPKIIISDTYTEVLLRNLLALELNDSGRQKVVTQYVELMDCLIDTPEDVKLLRNCHVIDRHSMMITDDYVAKMWDGMSKPLIFSGFLEPPLGLKAGIREVLMKNYYKSKIKSWWTEFQGEHLSRPWKALALFVAIFVLFLTTLQTYCSIKSCQPQA